MKVWISILSVLCCGAVLASDLDVQKAAGGDVAAERRLREAGKEGVNAIRDAKLDGEATLLRAREILTDIAIDTSKVDAASAKLLHELGREEGRAKRYFNAERLYGRAEQINNTLKSAAYDENNRVEAKEFDVLRKICSRMKDKAKHMRTGKYTGADFGFAHIGNEVDKTDNWE